MTKIERILAALRFSWVDRLPKGEFYLEDGFVVQLLGLKEKVEFKDRVEACEVCGLDALAISPSELTKAQEWEELAHWRKETDFFLFALIDGPFQGTAKLFPSFTDYLIALAKRDPLIPELVTQVVTENIQLGLKALAAGANGIIIADDLAYQQGTFVSPKVLREVVFPGLAKQVEVLKVSKSPIFFHADGNIMPVLEDIVGSGVDGIHSLELSSFAELAKIKSVSENTVCLMGGYDLGWFTEDNRTEKATELLSVLARGGGYIFGSSAGILDSNLSTSQVLEVYQFVSDFKLA